MYIHPIINQWLSFITIVFMSVQPWMNPWLSLLMSCSGFHVWSALNEARDISMHITVLGELMEDFENLNTFTEYEAILEPVFHTFCLIYSQSKYYNRPKRIIALMQVKEKKRELSTINRPHILFDKLSIQIPQHAWWFRARERSEQCGASERVSDAQQGNEWAMRVRPWVIGFILTSRFQEVLNHCAL